MMNINGKQQKYNNNFNEINMKREWTAMEAFQRAKWSAAIDRAARRRCGTTAPSSSPSSSPSVRLLFLC